MRSIHRFDQPIHDWIGCPLCGSSPEVLNDDPTGTLMQCSCGWVGKFAECWKLADAGERAA